MTIKYPVRCKIIDAEAQGHQVGPHSARTPKVSRPHIGKEGIAERIPREGNAVRISLDDGNILYGCECWWEPIVGAR
ncbi:hypothetical protein LCGC14_1366480 [marine sediment metagenome]|uniref:Uncharacterized protein n=1 Tax=marine sediment metagenome TaxID=412755 RepID=A0A0F9K6P3_9ZZZZ